MRTTIELPDELFRRLKVTAATKGLSMKDLMVAFVERGLYVSDEQPATPVQPPKVFTRELKGEENKLAVVPGLTEEQAVKVFGKAAAQVYLAARRRIQEKGYPDAG